MSAHDNPSSVRVDEKPQANTARGLRAGINGVKANISSLAAAGKVMSQLGPKQLKDEVQIAKIELKDKGKALGKGAAVLAVGLVFGLFLVIALVAAAILGLGKVVEPWLAALILAGIFLLLLAIFGFVGYRMVKAQLPFKPESALFGVLYDLGVLKHGSEMTSKRLKREQAEKVAQKQALKQEARDAEEAEPAQVAPALSLGDLKTRTEQRREHLKSLRDDVDAYSKGIQAQAQALVGSAKQSVKDAPVNTLAASRRLVSNAADPQVVQSRWKSFAALLASLSAFALFVKKFLKRK